MFNSDSVARIADEAINAFGPPSISLPLPPFLSVEDGVRAISVPQSPAPPLTSYDRLTRYISDHPFIATSGALSIAVLAVGLGYSLRDEDSFLHTTVRTWKETRGIKSKDGKTGYRLGSESGSSFLAGLRGGKPRHAGFLQSRADRLKGRKVDGMLKDAVLILAPSPLPPLLLPLILSLLNNDYIVFIAVPKSKVADDLERKIKLNEKVKAKGLSVAVRVMVYDPVEVSFHSGVASALLIPFTARVSGAVSTLSLGVAHAALSIIVVVFHACWPTYSSAWRSLCSGTNASRQPSQHHLPLCTSPESRSLAWNRRSASSNPVSYPSTVKELGGTGHRTLYNKR